MVLLFFLIGLSVTAQTNWEKPISFSLQDENLSQAFAKITKESGFRFAYNPLLIDTTQRFSYRFQMKRLERILPLLLPDSVQYKVSGNHIILQVKTLSQKSAQEDSRTLVLDTDTVSLIDELPILNDTTSFPIDSSLSYPTVSPIESGRKKDTNRIAHALTSPPSRIFSKIGEWNLELASGFRSENYQVVEGDVQVVSGRRLSVPPIELNAGYTVQNNTVIETGLAYVCTRINGSPVNSDYLFIKREKLLSAYSSLQIPLRLKYYIPFGKTGFALFGKIGFALQFTLSEIPTYELEHSTVSKEYDYSSGNISSNDVAVYKCVVRKSIPLNRFNLLYNTGIGFCYRFQNGIGFSVMGEYYLGLIQMGGAIIEYEETQYDYPIYSHGKCKLLYHGDYWNVAVGVSYQLKNK
ncbi:MAG: hypothetical protein LBV02_02770 [Bacteroidales bacterium]|nr:hypothetical protein [Bacteroidales bacterium]